MKIAAALGVKDEVELIERSLVHLRSVGVDEIFAFDMSSTDGTAELLESHRSEPGFHLVRLSETTPDDFRNFENLAAEEVRKAGVDWAIFLDADELWIPASGNLKDCEALAESDLLSVRRFNVPLGPQGPMLPADLAPERFGELLLIVDPISDLRAHLRENPETPFIRGVPGPKVMARPDRIGSMFVGWHDVVPADGAPLRRAEPSDLIIAHLPLTTRERFARKVANIRKVYAAHSDFLGADLGWHWRRWLEMDDAGRLSEEFDRSVFDDRTIAALCAEGVIRSAAEIFRSR